MDITPYLNCDYADSALYMNYRSTANFADGLKNSGRKCLFTVKKKGLPTTKVANFAGTIIDTSSYQHGNTSLEGTLVTLSQNFCGANNIPVLEGVGSFGTRHTPEAAAARYIFVKESKYLDLMFRKEDDPNLIQQTFEGKEIEPLYYMPTLPLILVNGVEGVGVGFSNKIFARPVSSMFKALKSKLEGKRLSKDYFIPGWQNFKGKVTQVPDTTTKWKVDGIATLKGKKLTIEEIPISFDLMSYLKVLRKAKVNGIIEKFIDFSENDAFKFEVTLTSEEANKPLEAIFKDLSLTEILTENLVCLDEKNAIKDTYKDTQEIFTDYYNLKLKSLAKRIKSEVKRLTEEEAALKEQVKYIKEVIKGTINLKIKKAEVEATLKEKGYKAIDKLLSMPMYSMTSDKIQELEKKVKSKKEELEVLKKETPETIWLKDLTELEKALKSEGLYF